MRIVRSLLTVLIIIGVAGRVATAQDSPTIRPAADNPHYWEYDGELVLLLGGSWQDNLFNHPQGLAAHLDLLRSVGGNYVRNVMSHRNEGNVFAYERDDDGLFDLDRFHDEYWRRFEDFLDLTLERDIIVQIEIWATWDHYVDHQSLGGWSHHPFNPENTSTYTPETSGLPTAIEYEPRGEPTDHPFFRSVPALDDNELVLGYQEAYVDRLLSYSLQYPHVLYCMNNETGERIEWGDYWASFVRARADDAGANVHTTDMRRNEDVRSEDHAHIYDHPDLYTFLDISQNNAWSGLGKEHYDRILHVRERTADHVRPINNVKNYGAARHGEEESVARMGRIVFAGSASARFHRPHPLEDPSAHEAASENGLGLSPRAQNVIRSLRMVTDEIEIGHTAPRGDLMGDVEADEAYLLAEPGRQYAAYFPKGGSATIDVSDAERSFSIRWMNLDESEWSDAARVHAGVQIRLTAPGDGHWVGVMLPVD